MGSAHSLSRQIMQRAAKADEEQPLRVIAIGTDAARGLSVDLQRVTLAEAAEHLVVLDVHDHDELSGVNVVHIPAGQKHNRLYENAEQRRRSRMVG